VVQNGPQGSNHQSNRISGMLFLSNFFSQERFYFCTGDIRKAEFTEGWQDVKPEVPVVALPSVPLALNLRVMLNPRGGVLL
jgi:hypothetical protein